MGCSGPRLSADVEGVVSGNGGYGLSLSFKPNKVIRITVLLMLVVSGTLVAMSPGSSEGGVAVEEALRAAAGGSKSQLQSLGRQGGEGSWFALAEAAEEYGYPQIAKEMRQKSYQADPAPYGVVSLTTLLTDDPRAIGQPLTELRRAERRDGSRNDIRRARITVLAALGRRRALAREVNDFTGQSWEAPVLAALVTLKKVDLTGAARIERFVLHSDDPAALILLPEETSLYLRPETTALLDARLAFASEDYSRALEGYRRWLDGLMGNPEICESEDPPPPFYEISAAAIQIAEEETWSEILANAAGVLNQAKRYAAAYNAGRLYRRLGAANEAAAAFISAAASVPAGLPVDRALWLRLKTVHEDYSVGSTEEVEAFSWAAANWTDPDRFTDRLEEFIHRRVRRGEWLLLEAQYRHWSHRWPEASRAYAAGVLAFATYEGRLNGRSHIEYLEELHALSPLSWWGLRAAGILHEDIVPDPRIGIEAAGEADRIVDLLLRWGLIERAVDAVYREPGAYADETIRNLARALSDRDPRLSIRTIGLLWNRDGYSPGSEDLLLRYPLPLPDMAEKAADGENLPREIFFGLIRTESAWDADAVSRSGAQGLAQFMPATWDEWVRRMKYPVDSDPMDPETNLVLGAAYLDWLLEREWTGSWVDVLASYNAGGGRLRTWRRERPGLGDDLFGASIPVEEPRSYVAKVLSAGTIYGYLYADRSPRELHSSWGLPMLQE